MLIADLKRVLLLDRHTARSREFPHMVESLQRAMAPTGAAAMARAHGVLGGGKKAANGAARRRRGSHGGR